MIIFGYTIIIRMKNIIKLGFSCVGLLLTAGLASAATTYDYNTGLRGVYYSAASYCALSTINPWNCGEPCTMTQGVTNVKPISNSAHGTQGYVAFNGQTKEIIVAFRGSQNIENWITNLDYFKTNYKNVPNAQVHRGFLEAYNAVASEVISGVKGLIGSYPTASIFVTGHSLGGALAIFAAADIKETLKPGNRFTIYTYGCPRTGDQGWTDYFYSLFPEVSQRVVHASDVVPHLPITAMGFNHVGTEIWYNKGNELTYATCANKPGQPENKSCADTVILTSVADHLKYLQ
jgi:predicted lipase